MQYCFKHSDGRNYKNSISDGLKLEIVKGGTETVIMKVLSLKETLITLTLNTKEADFIARCLLASLGNSSKISAEYNK